MDVTMVLCDYAEVVNGKIYIMGGGWEQLRANAPAPVAVALLIGVPWDQTNVQHELTLALTDEDGHEVTLPGVPEPIVQKAQFEAGRPAGVAPGTSQTAPLAFRFPVLPLPPGGYSFVVSVDDAEKARVSFRTR